MTAKRETSEKRERMIGECHICSSSAPGARPLEDNTHAWQTASGSSQHTGQQGRNENKKMKVGRRFKIQMKEEVRRSNCDKGLEKWNCRVKEGKKREEENVIGNTYTARSYCCGSSTL